MNVELTELTRRFGRTEAVAGVDLQAGPGVFGLLGPNGAGKTSLLRMMATVCRPVRARCACSAGIRAATGHAGRSGAGSVTCRRPSATTPGSPWPSSSSTSRCSRTCRRARSHGPWRRAIEHVGLGDKARKKLRTLSGGMLRRVGIAQAIVNQPELLLLDEPTAGLDPEQRVAFRTLLREFGQRATVIVSTHLVEDVAAACTEVTLMDAGKIVFHGTPDELIAQGEGHGVGDAPLERGYTAALAAARS